MSKFNVETIYFKLEAGEFNALQSLMLKAQLMDSFFYNFEIRTPQFSGDTYKAFYLKNAKLMVNKQGKVSLD